MNSRPTILISAVGGDIGAALCHALWNICKKMIGCDMRPAYIPGLNLHRIATIPSAQDPSFSAALIDLIRQENIDIYFPASEPEIRVVNHIRRDIEKLDVKIAINNSLIINTFLDKLKTIQFLQKMDINVPRTVLFKKYKGQFDFPFIVKSRFGCGSKTVRLVEDTIDLEYIKKKRFVDLIAQEYIGTAEDEYTTGVFSDGFKTESISFRRKLGYGGLSVEAELVCDKALQELSIKVAKATGLCGAINIQSRKVGDQYIPFEINPRISSTVMFRKHFGFDDAVWWVKMLRGEKIRYMLKSQKGRAIRYLDEYYFDAE